MSLIKVAWTPFRRNPVKATAKLLKKLEKLNAEMLEDKTASYKCVCRSCGNRVSKPNTECAKCEGK